MQICIKPFAVSCRRRSILCPLTDYIIFIYGLFDHALNASNYVAMNNDVMVSEQ